MVPVSRAFYSITRLSNEAGGGTCQRHLWRRPRSRRRLAARDRDEGCPETGRAAQERIDPLQQPRCAPHGGVVGHAALAPADEAGLAPQPPPLGRAPEPRRAPGRRSGPGAQASPDAPRAPSPELAEDQHASRAEDACHLGDRPRWIKDEAEDG